MVKVRVMRRNEKKEMEEVAVAPLIMTEELSELIGMQLGQAIMEVERGAIKRYAQAIGDTNPLYNDLEYARSSQYGEIICPPGFFGWPVVPDDRAQAPVLVQRVAKSSRLMIFAGGGEVEFMLPIRSGDVLTCTRRIADIYEEIGSSGNRLLLIITETTYINQNDDIVAKERSRTLYA